MDANPYDKYPNYNSVWGDPVAPWNGVVGGGPGKTRDDACYAVRTQALPEYIKRTESGGARRVTKSSDCVCKNYAFNFGWVDFFNCYVYVQIDRIKVDDRKTVDR